MKIRKRTIIIGIIIIIFAFIGLNIYNSSKASKKVTVTPIKKGNLEVIVSASGKVQSSSTAELSFTGAGRVSYLPVKEGDYVKKGQVLAYLDGSTIKQQENKAWADYRLQLEKIREFEENNKDKPKDTDYQIAKSQLEATRDGYAALVAQTLTSYKDKTLISPIDGLIAQITADVGETPGTEPVITVVDENSVEFIAEVDEQDIGTITVGLSATITLDAYSGKEFSGTVTKIESVAKTGSTGNVYYPVHIMIGNSDSKLLIGMSGDADIRTAEKKDITIVPLDLVIDEDDDRIVYVVENSKVVKKTIKLGLESDIDGEVISGLNPGDQVITSDAATLKEGETVEITPAAK